MSLQRSTFPLFDDPLARPRQRHDECEALSIPRQHEASLISLAVAVEVAASDGESRRAPPPPALVQLGGCRTPPNGARFGGHRMGKSSPPKADNEQCAGQHWRHLQAAATARLTS